MSKFTLTQLLILPILVSGCTTNTPEADAAYISPSFYQGFNCKQLKMERQRIAKKIEVAIQTDGTTQVLNAAVAAYAISQGYGVDDSNGNAVLRRLKNQEDVLEQTAIQKECNL